MEVVNPSSVNERIIPIKILDSCHGKNFGQGLLTPPPSPSLVGTKPKRQSLLVTYDDGTTTETQGIVTNLNNNFTINNNNIPQGNNVTIQEIGINSLEREIKNVNQIPKTENLQEKETAQLKNQQQRHVPIRLDDGKIIQREPDETLKISSQFTNFSHEEILDSQSNKFPNPTLKDSTTQPDLMKVLNERIIPIKLESGEEIMPIFTKLEDPEPPAWSTFSKKSNLDGNSSPLKEKIIPMKVETETEPPQEERGRKKSKQNEASENATSSRSDLGGETHRSSRSIDRKQHTVRFNVNEEKRSESRESYTRKSSSNRNYRHGKPPSGSVDRHSYTSGDQPRRQIYPNKGSYRSDSPSLRREQPPDGDQKTLMDIDRDINRIWKELQELDATKPAKCPPTPIKIRSYTIPSAAQPERISRSTPPPTSIPLSSSLPNSNQRTIWDSDVPKYPSTFLPSHQKIQSGQPDGKDQETKKPRLSPSRPTIGGISKTPNQTDFIVAPLASAETPGSPNLSNENDNPIDKNLSTNDFDDGTYEGLDLGPPASRWRHSKREKSSSPSKKSPKENTTISSEIQVIGSRSDAATQTWKDEDDNKKYKKAGSCTIL